MFKTYKRKKNDFVKINNKLGEDDDDRERKYLELGGGRRGVEIVGERSNGAH